VQDIAQAVALADELGLAPVVRFTGAASIATLASPLTLHDSPVRYHRAPPALGADDDEVRAWLAGEAGEPP
jgi:crotonobetainyl-CoA:carnitine CoA-transferase CaiB-like acyl-CoA transferase